MKYLLNSTLSLIILKITLNDFTLNGKGYMQTMWKVITNWRMYLTLTMVPGIVEQCNISSSITCTLPIDRKHNIHFFLLFYSNKMVCPSYLINICVNKNWAEKLDNISNVYILGWHIKTFKEEKGILQRSTHCRLLKKETILVKSYYCGHPGNVLISCKQSVFEHVATFGNL